MKSLMGTLFVLGISWIVVSPAGWSAEFNYASYTQTTLQNIITEEQNHSFALTNDRQAAEHLQLECIVSKYRVLCRYSNIRRPISEKKKNMIKLWMETLMIDPNLASLYRQEIRVTEGMNVLWIPVQEQLFQHINQEIVKNDMIEIFIILTGKVESEFVFIATEFEKSVSPGKKSIEATAYARAAPEF